MKRSSLTAPLLLVLLVALVLVVADQTGLLPRPATPDSAADSLERRYLDAHARSIDQAFLLSNADRLSDARRQAEQRWDDVRRTLVIAPSVELAEARLRELVLASLADVKLLSPARVTTIKEASPDAAATIRPISLRVDFDAGVHRDAYIALDRVSNLPDARVVITSLSLDGPGRAQIPQQVTVSITIRAAALIEQGGPT